MLSVLPCLTSCMIFASVPGLVFHLPLGLVAGWVDFSGFEPDLLVLFRILAYSVSVC